jgi:hypothetical protein
VRRATTFEGGVTAAAAARADAGFADVLLSGPATASALTAVRVFLGIPTADVAVEQRSMAHQSGQSLLQVRHSRCCK